MAARKTAASADNEACAVGAKQPRELPKVVEEMRKLRDEGKTVPEIAEELQCSYHVVNQVMVQSYKISTNTVEVFERQERMRLGLDSE